MWENFPNFLQRLKDKAHNISKHDHIFVLVQDLLLVFYTMCNLFYLMIFPIYINHQGLTHILHQHHQKWLNALRLLRKQHVLLLLVVYHRLGLFLPRCFLLFWKYMCRFLCRNLNYNLLRLQIKQRCLNWLKLYKLFEK